MKAKKIAVLVLTFLIVATFGAFGSACRKEKAPDPPSPPSPSITIDKSTAELDLYETVLLTAQKENTDAEIVWTSSAPDVASVDSGLVKALKTGNTTVTATAGDVSASCAVTVTDSGTAPVIRVDREYVAVDKDGEVTVSVYTDWKNEPITDPIQYAWTLAEGEDESVASITPSADGSEVVIKGLEYGETAFCVNASVRGSLLVKKVTVKICGIDVIFDVQNLTLTEGAYGAELSLVATETEVTSITPDIRVYEKEELVEDAEIVWTNSNDAVAGMENGVIVGRTEGVTTLTGTYKNNDIKIKVTVCRPLIELEQKVEIETKNAALALNFDLAGAISGAELDGRNIFSAYDADEEIIRFDPTALPKAAEDMGDGKRLIIDTDKAQYAFAASVCTMIIDDEEELNGFLDVAKENSIGSSWSGLFVLGGDITCQGTYASHYVGGGTTAPMGTAAGFNGIFDGRGHTIYNLHTVGSAGGFVSPLGQHGVVKNVSFVNAKNTGNGAFMSSVSSGTVQDVYIQIDVTPNNKTELEASSVLFSDAPGECRINNVIVEYINKLPDDAVSGYPLWRFNYSCGIINGVYAVGVSKFNQTSNFTDRDDVYGVYDDWTQFKSAETDFGSWNKDFWSVIDGVPVPASLVKSAPDPVISNTETTVQTDCTVDIRSNVPYLTFTLDADAQAKGLRLNGRTVTIPADSTCVRFTVTATSAINGKTASKVFNILSTVTVSERKQVEINKSWTEQTELSVDLTGCDFDGGITSAKIGNTAFPTVRYESNILYFDKATVADMYGEKTIMALAETDDGKQTLITIPVLLVTRYIDNSNFQYIENYMVDVDGGKSGYFVQTGDIDATGKGKALAASFYGVYDGGGHVISDICIRGYEIGMFTKLQAGAVVKNITFMNAVINGNGGIVSSECCGTVENIVVYGSFDNDLGDFGAVYAPPSLLVSKVQSGGVIRNCLVVAKDHGFTKPQSEGTEYAGMICGDWQDGTIENCIAVNLKNGATKAEYVMPAIGSKANGRFEDNTDTDTVHTFHGWKEYMDWVNGKDLSSYNGSAWEFLDNQTPVTAAESVQAALSAITANDQIVVAPGRKLVLGYDGWYASYTIGDLPEGVTYADGVFDISDTASGSFTVTVTSLLDGTKSGTFTVTVTASAV